jgi:hypothetical protein
MTSLQAYALIMSGCDLVLLKCDPIMSGCRRKSNYVPVSGIGSEGTKIEGLDQTV